jgi:AraC-like DNA-binding protein
MTTVDPALLEKVLASVDVRLGSARRTAMDAGDLLPLPDGVVTLAYVVEGEITGGPMIDTGCAIDVSGGSAVATAAARTLLTGDAFLSMGRHPIVLKSTSGARLMTAELELGPAAAVEALPGFVFVTGFADLEPAAAALAMNLGPADPAPTGARSGDPLICRLMVTTVLLSVIRAWAQNGCAPQDWTARAHDPFLTRVIEAIHAEPGRDWTVDLLATVGAMSRSVFAERFRDAVGRSPASYVADVRMRSAKELLDAGRSVSEVSRELGYSSDEGFSRAFRRHTGVPPSLWRANRGSSVPV